MPNSPNVSAVTNAGDKRVLSIKCLPWYCCAPRLSPLCCCGTWLSFFKTLFLLTARLDLALFAALFAFCSFLFSFIMSSVKTKRNKVLYLWFILKRPLKEQSFILKINDMNDVLDNIWICYLFELNRERLR